MDSSIASTRSPKAEAEIKAYINRTVGFERLDKVVLGAIVASCVQSAEEAFVNLEDHGASVLRAVADMLYEVGDFHGALVQLEAVLEKEVAVHGEGVAETAETIYMIGMCHNNTDGNGLEWFKRSLKLDEERFGEEHARTARSLIEIGFTYINRIDEETNDYPEALERYNLAIARIEAADCPSDHIDAHAKALMLLGKVHAARKDWQASIQLQEQSVRLQESKYGLDPPLAYNAIALMADSHGKLGNFDKERDLLLKALEITQRTKGPLSREAGCAYSLIAITHELMGESYEQNVLKPMIADFLERDGQYDEQSAGRLNQIIYGQYAEAAAWYKRAVEAMEHTHGLHSEPAGIWLVHFASAVDRMDQSDAKTQEHRRFIASKRVPKMDSNMRLDALASIGFSLAIPSNLMAQLTRKFEQTPGQTLPPLRAARIQRQLRYQPSAAVWGAGIADLYTPDGREKFS
jgi:tetratricopeptide (TPR) repeat protein